MRRTAKSASAAGTAALLIAILAAPSAAQYASRQGAPYIRVYSRNGPGVISSYVEPAIDVSENAYVFAVSMDLDGLVQVLHPDAPGISIRILQHRQLFLPNFFAGYTHPGGRSIDATGQYADYPDEYGGENDSRGTVIALASRVPFNLERVETQGAWDISTIRDLVENRSPAAAAQALASYLGAQGEPIGRDYMRFASARQNYYSSNAPYSCDLYYGTGLANLGVRRSGLLDRVSRLRRSGRTVSVVGYDFCGMPIVAFGPSQVVPFHPPRPRRDPDDTLGGKGKSETAVLGNFVITKRAAQLHRGPVSVDMPIVHTASPRGGLIDRLGEPHAGELSGTTRTPVERDGEPSGRTRRQIESGGEPFGTIRTPVERGELSGTTRMGFERTGPARMETNFNSVPPRENPRPIMREAPPARQGIMARPPVIIERAPSPPPARAQPSPPPPKKQ